MKQCIWCSRNEEDVPFEKKAHTIPKSLGGKHLCKDVCDLCNHYFGSPMPNLPSVELVFKEVFNISRFFLLDASNEREKIGRYKSEFFNINWNARTIRTKPKYSLKNHFQEKMGRQFKRAIYKVFLEDRARMIGDAHDEKFNFIREFARYDLVDYPLFYFTPANGAIFFSSQDAIHPEIRFSEHHERIIKEYRFYEFSLMGHFFAIPTTSKFDLFKNEYVKYCKSEHSQLYSKMIEVKRLNQVDFTFSFMNEKK
ncbi:HNH endonuclease [Marivirga sp.]|uniref:HNH endonuclease n=1 Tax=Marivirga sp. TaxID=2018662 RepID=UPI003DA719BB